MLFVVVAFDIGGIRPWPQCHLTLVVFATRLLDRHLSLLIVVLILVWLAAVVLVSEQFRRVRGKTRDKLTRP